MTRSKPRGRAGGWYSRTMPAPVPSGVMPRLRGRCCRTVRQGLVDLADSLDALMREGDLTYGLMRRVEALRDRANALARIGGGMVGGQ